jgi:hypothetical protein
MESSTDFLHRGVIVIDMGIQNVHIIHLQSLERFFDAFLDVFSISSALTVELGLRGSAYLCRDNHVLSWNLEILEDFSELALASAKIVKFCCVEMVNSVF